MDLLDGSDVEEGDVDLDEENALLGSDEEEYANAGGVGVEYEYDEEHILHTEDGDVLELELNDEDGFEFGEDSSGHRRMASVQVRSSAIQNRQHSQANGTNSSSAGVQHESADIIQEQESYGTEIGPGGKTEMDGEDDDEDDEDRNTRSRFQSERNTQLSNASTLQGERYVQQRNASLGSDASFGNPIQSIPTLGGRQVPTGGDGQRQKQWGNGRPNPHPQGPRQFGRPQRFPHHRHPLLGEGPRSGFNPFFPRPQLNGGANVQFQERIFTDFNRPMRQQNPQHLAIVQGQRPPLGGPRHQGNMNNSGPRPVNLGGPPRPRQLNPPFPLPGNNNNNRQMRPRNPNPGHMNQRPPQPWRNQRPQRHPFPGMPNQQMQNMAQMQPGPTPFHQEQRPRPPLFGNGMRHEIQPQNPFNNLPGPNVQVTPQTTFGPGPNIGQHPFRMPMGPPEMMPGTPVHPVQPFFHNQQREPFMQEPNQNPINHNPQGYWPAQNNENNVWGGPPIPPTPQNFMGPPVLGQHTHTAFQLPMPIESAMPHQSSHFMEPQIHQERPGPMYDQSHHRPEPTYFEQQRPQYQYEQDSRGNNYEHENRGQVRVSEPPSRREDFEERSEYPYPPHRQERMPSKRKCEPEEDRYYRGSPEKRLNGRLGPPVRHEPPARDEKAEELMKIREETRKTMGLDDEYIKKLEDQKKLREQILRRKAEARRKINGSQEEESYESYSRKISNELLKTEAVTSKATGRPSIYINPKAFRGDLSALNSNLKKINMSSVEGGQPSFTTPSSSKVSVAVKNDGSVGNVSTKSRTILRIVKDKHGNVISRSKVLKRPKQQPSASTKAS